MNASASDAIESAAKSVLLGFVDLRLAFFFPRDETKSERDGSEDLKKMNPYLI